MVRLLGTSGWSVLVLSALLGTVVACGGDSFDDGAKGPGTGAPPALSLELASDPEVTYDASRGRTQVVVQFIARDAAGVPLDAEDVNVTLEVDARPVDNESLLEDSSEELAASLFYSLVLDASGSMLQHTPSAFGPMLAAARASVEAGLALWEPRPGVFEWDVCWFNEQMFRREGDWRPQDLEAIPVPPLDAGTKAYAAVEYMAQELTGAYQEGRIAGLRDHHVMVVLSDGADNQSWFDNASLPTERLATATGAGYRKFGAPAADLGSTVAAIQAHPRLTVHVLAMGSKFYEEDFEALQTLADAGSGQLLRNPDSAQIGDLFQRVTKEFTTLQTRGAAIPQPPGEYVFRVAAQSAVGGAADALEFRYRAGPDAAYLPPEPAP